MVKRQTVWLSTMMVLSLMLIGYYTMNNGAQATGTQGNGTTPVTDTNVVTPTVAESTGNPVAGTTTPSVATSGADFFTNWQTNVKNEISRSLDQELQVIANNNATAQQISQAQDELKQLNNLQGGIQNAQDAVVSDGYQDCAIVPSSDNSKLDVWVKSKKPLTALDAASIQYIVNQQIGSFPMNAIVVHQHK